MEDCLPLSIVVALVPQPLVESVGKAAPLVQGLVDWPPCSLLWKFLVYSNVQIGRGNDLCAKVLVRAVAVSWFT